MRDPCRLTLKSWFWKELTKRLTTNFLLKFFRFRLTKGVQKRYLYIPKVPLSLLLDLKMNYFRIWRNFIGQDYDGRNLLLMSVTMKQLGMEVSTVETNLHRDQYCLGLGRNCQKRIDRLKFGIDISITLQNLVATFIECRFFFSVSIESYFFVIPPNLNRIK
jgi:hypothetical protein